MLVSPPAIVPEVASVALFDTPPVTAPLFWVQPALMRLPAMVPLVVSQPVFATPPVIVPPFVRRPALPRPADAVRLAARATATVPALVSGPARL